MIEYTKREGQAAALAKQFGERMGLMSTRNAYNMIYRGMIEDCPEYTNDLHRETAKWNKSLGNLKA